MRKLLIIVGVILAILVAAHYARWKWANPNTYSHYNSSAVQNGHSTCGTVAEAYQTPMTTGNLSSSTWDTATQTRPSPSSSGNATSHASTHHPNPGKAKESTSPARFDQKNEIQKP
jgi:hypothetical protein